jgi:hypothetical protein
LRRVLGLRFLVEAAFIALVAAAVWYVGVSNAGIFGALAGAWLLVVLAEWLLSRRDRELLVIEPAEADTPPPPAPQRVVEPHRWNLWELERVARDTVGADAARDEEQSFLLMYLREFADPGGMLPATFDGLVREAFGDVLRPGHP